MSNAGALETFANLYATCAINDKEQIRVAEKYLPNTTKAFKKILKKEYNSGMEWVGGCARFQVDGVWYRSGIVSAHEKPYVMHGFIERESEDMPPFSECWDEDDEPMTDKEKAAAEKVVMRFFQEGYVVRDGMFQDFCMVCVLDGEDYPVLDVYGNMQRNPKSAEEVWWFYHGE